MNKKVQWNSKFPKFQQKTFITGKGLVTIGKRCSFGYKLGGFNYKGCIELQSRYKNAQITIGNNISMNNNVFICCANNVKIGDHTLIGCYVTIIDHEAHMIAPDSRNKIGEIGEVIIGANVWLGNNVTILKNSVIGDNSVVAVGAVVSGQFPPNVIIGGIPAKIIREINV